MIIMLVYSYEIVREKNRWLDKSHSPSKNRVYNSDINEL